MISILGSTPLSTILGAAPPATSDTAVLKRFAKAATGAGLALLLIVPGSKTPADVRSPQQRRKEDGAAQDAAREAGRPDYLKARSLAGAHLATTDDKLICRYIDRYRTAYGEDVAVNFGVEVGRSHIVVVDCDTAEQMQGFLTDAGISPMLPVPPTVITPGSRDEEGNWSHSNGGHFWFTTTPEMFGGDPEYLRSLGSGSFTAPSGYAVLWRDRYVLIPPSVRPEGVYTSAGPEYPLPEWLRDGIVNHTRVRVQKTGEDSGELTELVDRWSDSVTWDDLLAPMGWTLAGRTDNCGCDIWTAPGVHASPKSATTHDTSCSLGRYTTVNAPMHIWTDNPGEEFEQWIRDGGSKTVSKLQVAAIANYRGNVGTAVAEMGLLPGKDDIVSELGFDPNGITQESGVDVAALDERIELPGRINLAKYIPDNERHKAIMVSNYDPNKGETCVAKPAQCSTCGAALGPEDHVVAVNNGNLYHRPAGVSLTHRADGNAASGDVPVNPDPPPNTQDTIGRESEWHCMGCGELLPVSTYAADGNGNVWHPLSDGNTHRADVMEPQSTFPDMPSPGIPPDDMVLKSENTHVPHIAPFKHWRNMPAPEYAVEGLIENGALTAIIGPPGVGKSTIALDIASALVTGRRWQGRKVMKQRVLYLPGEGLAGAVQRVLAWEDAHDAGATNLGDDLLLGDSILQLGADREAWTELVAYILQHRVGLIIFDTFARMSLGLEENSAKDVGKAVERFKQIHELTGAGVMVVHHTAKGTTSGRGSSALFGAMDSELLIQSGDWDHPEVPGEPVTLWTNKQKNAARLKEPMPLMLKPHGDSVIVTGVNGAVEDPYDEVASVPTYVKEPIVETAIRLFEYARKFPVQGLTRSEFLADVMPDEYTAHRADAGPRWKRIVAQAVDLALRFELLQTLTGTPSGARYITSTSTIEEARLRAAGEVITD